MPTSLSSGTQTATVKAIVSSTNATPINIQATAHGYSTGNTVTIAGHLVNTSANGHWTITNIDANNFTLTGSVGNGVGVATGTVGLEHTLATDTTNAVYVFVADLAAMADGDICELRVYTKVLTAGTSRLAYPVFYAHAQAAPIKYSVPIPADIECKVTLTQPAGVTGRAYPWKLLEIP